MTNLTASFPTKRTTEPVNVDMRHVAVVIMGGGQGSRLFPLTASRCKPAICYGGDYRLIDIPISNAINSGCQKIFVITQFLSHSLHKHIFNTYRPGAFFSGFIDILSVEERPQKRHWLQGTADSIRQNLHYLQETSAEYILILSGDQLYQMDFSKMLLFAQESNAGVVMATLPVPQSNTAHLGILSINEEQWITSFIEKPQTLRELEGRELSKELLDDLEIRSNIQSPHYLASMGIYLFKRELLVKLLQEDEREDFGKHLIPSLVSQNQVAAYIHKGYWEDIGTIGSYYQANMAFNSQNPPLNCYDENWRICSYEPSLPGTRVVNTQLTEAMLSKGSVIEADSITNSIIGPRTVIKQGTMISDSYLMGSDFYGPSEIGQDCVIQKTIIDKHVQLGDRVKLVNQKNLTHYDSDHVYIRDGIIIVPRGVKLPDGFII